VNLFRVLKDTVLGTRDCPDQTALRARGTTEIRSRPRSSSDQDTAPSPHLHSFRASPRRRHDRLRWTWSVHNLISLHHGPAKAGHYVL